MSVPIQPDIIRVSKWHFICLFHKKFRNVWTVLVHRSACVKKYTDKVNIISSSDEMNGTFISKICGVWGCQGSWSPLTGVSGQWVSRPRLRSPGSSRPAATSWSSPVTSCPQRPRPVRRFRQSVADRRGREGENWLVWVSSICIQMKKTQIFPETAQSNTTEFGWIPFCKRSLGLKRPRLVSKWLAWLKQSPVEISINQVTSWPEKKPPNASHNIAVISHNKISLITGEIIITKSHHQLGF